MPRLLTALLAIFFAAGLTHFEAAEISITKLDFDLVDQANARDPWYQVSVTLNVEQGDRGVGENPRFANDIGVEFSFATATERRGGQQYAFYSAKAEFATMEVGRQIVRFYLPPGVVKRDRIRGEPYVYLAEISSGDDVYASLVSKDLEQEERLAEFRKRMQGAVQSILLLEHETPFAWTSPRDVPVAKRR